MHITIKRITDWGIRRLTNKFDITMVGTERTHTERIELPEHKMPVDDWYYLIKTAIRKCERGIRKHYGYY